MVKNHQLQDKRVPKLFFDISGFVALTILITSTRKIPMQGKKKKSQMQNRFFKILKFLFVIEEKDLMISQNHTLLNNKAYL